MTQFKDKGSDKEKARVFVHISKLMAADIFAKIAHVPVEPIKNNIWNYQEILHKNLTKTLIVKTFSLCQSR